MPSEHKIKINDTKKLHASLKRLNANQISISKIKDIYFKQPNGTVLKIRSEEGKPDRVIYCSRNEFPYGNLIRTSSMRRNVLVPQSLGDGGSD